MTNSTISITVKRDSDSLFNFPWTATTENPRLFVCATTRKSAIRQVTRKYKRYIKNHSEETVIIDV